MKVRFAALLVLLACFCVAFAAAFEDFEDGTIVPDISTPVAKSSAANGTVTPTDNCPEMYTCLGNSDTTCSASWSVPQNHTYCVNNNGTNCCANGLFCVSGTCQPNNIGSYCDALSPCYGAAYEQVTCYNKTCTYLSYAGDNCDDENVCVDGLSCNSDGICVGSTEGQSCSGTTLQANCSAGLYCSSLTATCEGYAQLNAPCNSSVACAADLYCTGSKNNFTCQLLYNNAEGSQCTQDIQCADGNTCQSGTCKSPASDYLECTTDSDCAGGTSCKCSLFTGNSYCTDATYYNPCQSNTAEALTCQADNNCTVISANEESCFYNNCYSELKDIQSCGCDNSDAFYDSCYYNNFCGGFPAWAIALIIIGAIAVALACVAVVFVAMRRKNTYDSI